MSRPEESTRPWVHLLRLWFDLHQPVSRRAYLASGLSLAAFKFGLDNTVLFARTGGLWTPWAYLAPSLWFRDRAFDGPVPLDTYVVLGLIALPFLWIGVSMSVRRAADAGHTPWLGLLFLVPVVNYVLMATLAVLPSRGGAGRGAREDAGRTVAESGEGPPLGQRTVDLLFAAGCGAGLASLGTVAAIYVAEHYGAALFFAVPFAVGVVSVRVLQRRIEYPLRQALAASAGAVLFGGLALLLFAIEGALCLLMALPLALIAALLGGAIAWYVPRLFGGSAKSAAMVVMLAPPGLMGVEAAVARPQEREVVTAIDIDAPPDRVWPHVAGFTELDEPPAWFFELGIAYPKRAVLFGRGKGATRLCEFSTGPFVEPITEWNPPRRLSFDVVWQPPMMKEWSPYAEVKPPHLEDHFVSRRGQFRLTPLPGGRTRLEGSTWYTLSFYPESYWVIPAEWILHAIHNRVLRHVRRRAERAPSNVTPG